MLSLNNLLVITLHLLHGDRSLTWLDPPRRCVRFEFGIQIGESHVLVKDPFLLPGISHLQ
jgi:hypothetical protein